MHTAIDANGGATIEPHAFDSNTSLIRNRIDGGFGAGLVVPEVDPPGKPFDVNTFGSTWSKCERSKVLNMGWKVAPNSSVQPDEQGRTNPTLSPPLLAGTAHLCRYCSF